MIQDSGQTGQTAGQGFFASCWESICAFFRKFLCYICCPTSRVAHSDENQAPVVPISQRSITSADGTMEPSSLVSTHTFDDRSPYTSTPMPSLTESPEPSEPIYSRPRIPERHVEVRHITPELRTEAQGLIEPGVVPLDQDRPPSGEVRHFRIWQDDSYKPDRIWFEEALLDDAILRSDDDLSSCQGSNNGNLFESINDPQGSAGIACHIAHENRAHPKRQAIVIAGNHGKAGGGLVDPFYILHPRRVFYAQGGQEESLVANFLMTRFYLDTNSMTDYYDNNLVNQWGMALQPKYPTGADKKARREVLLQTVDNYHTIQNVDYFRVANSSLYGDAWQIDAEVSVFYYTGRRDNRHVAGCFDQQNQRLILDRNYPTQHTPVDFIFCAAPNASGPRDTDSDRTGSMAKTTCQNAYVTEDDLRSSDRDEIIREKFEFFKDGIRYALRAAFDKAIDSRVRIIQVPWLGGSIYAGRFTRLGLWKLQTFHELLNEVLEERVIIEVLRESGEIEIIEGARRAQYFDRVILGGLGPSNYSSQ